MRASLLVLLVAPILVFAQDGTYTGTGKGGKRGPVSVSVTVKGGKLSNVKVTSTKEDKTYAHDQVIKAMVKNNNINVDSVSGATMTSKATVAAVKNALGTNASKFMGKTSVKPMK